MSTPQIAEGTEDRVFALPIDPAALATRVLAERSSWDQATRAAYYVECRLAMATLITDEQRELAYKRRLEMDCPECGQSQQPAGHNCWKCLLPMVPSEWFDRRERYPGRKMTEDERKAAVARLEKGRRTREAARAAA